MQTMRQVSGQHRADTIEQGENPSGTRPGQPPPRIDLSLGSPHSGDKLPNLLRQFVRLP
jgi:hypothetical protein